MGALGEANGIARAEHTNADDIELKAAFEQLLLDLVGDAVEPDVALREHGLLGRLRIHRCRHLRGYGLK